MNVRTYRFTGHFVGDPQVYREKGEVQPAPGDAGSARAAARAARHDRARSSSAIDAEVTAEVEACVEFAKAGTDPQPEDALKWVYAEGSMERDG